MAKTNYALTTVDNPHNPFENFVLWWDCDMLNGHRTSSKLANEAMTSPELSDEENDAEMQRAMDKIIAEDPTNLYVRVTESDFEGGRWLREVYQSPSRIEKGGIGGSA